MSLQKYFKEFLRVLQGPFTVENLGEQKPYVGSPHVHRRITTERCVRAKGFGTLYLAKRLHDETLDAVLEGGE